MSERFFNFFRERFIELSLSAAAFRARFGSVPRSGHRFISQSSACTNEIYRVPHRMKLRAGAVRGKREIGLPSLIVRGLKVKLFINDHFDIEARKSYGLSRSARLLYLPLRNFHQFRFSVSSAISSAQNAGLSHECLFVEASTDRMRFTAPGKYFAL